MKYYRSSRYTVAADLIASLCKLKTVDGCLHRCNAFVPSTAGIKKKRENSFSSLAELLDRLRILKAKKKKRKDFIVELFHC